MSSTAFFLVIDQGGHASRALIYDQRGQLVARGYHQISPIQIGSDRVEYDAGAMLASINQAIDSACHTGMINPQAIAACGLATQRSNIVCWDKFSGQPLSPILSWQDRRADQWLKGLSPRADEIHKKTGLFISAHYGASKMRWCLDHIEEVKEANKKQQLIYGPMASFLLHRLLLERPLVCDPVNASRTLLWNIHQRNWDPELLEMFGLSAASLPKSVANRHAYGNLAYGGNPAIPMQIVCGDQSAALFASGEVQADTAYINLGTGAFVQRYLGNGAVISPRLMTSIVFDDGDTPSYVYEGTVNGAGSAIDWICKEFTITNINDHLPDWLNQERNPPLLINGIAGLGAPYWIADFPSTFIGKGSPAGKAVAVIESIVFMLYVNLKMLDTPTIPLKSIRIGGGLANLGGLCQRLADLSGLPVYRPQEHEVTARGMLYLLQGCPPDWQEDQPGVWFSSDENPALINRFERWDMEMNNAVTRINNQR